MTDQVNLIGLFRSGTNFTRTVLEWNFDVDVVYDAYGWKHAFVPTFSDFSPLGYPDGKLLVVVRNPYSALVSWYRYATGNGRNICGDTRSFSAFLRGRVYFRDDTNSSLKPEYYFSNPIQMWNSVVWNHVSVAKQAGGCVVEYDELLRRPEATCNRIARHLGLKRKSEDFEIPQKRLRNMHDGMQSKQKARYQTNKQFDGSGQLDKDYLAEYSDEDLAFVRESVASELASMAGMEPDAKGQAEIPAALCTLSSDSRLLPLACLFESNHGLEKLPVRLIPFDDDAPLTLELAGIYGAEVVEPEPKWDRLGKAIYGNAEYRPGIPAWKYFRKLNVFDGTRRRFLFADSNVVLLNSVEKAFRVLDKYDIAFGDRSRKGRNFPPWSTFVLNRLDANLEDGFNASFWVSRADFFNDMDIETLINRPGIRAMLGQAPEQSFMLLMAVLLRKRLGALGEIDEDIRPTVWGDVSPPKEIQHVLEHNVTRNGKIPLGIKWSGAAFHRKEAIASAQVYRGLFDRILEQVSSSPGLVAELKKQYTLAIGGQR